MIRSFSIVSILISLLLCSVSSNLRSEEILEGKAWVALVAMGPKPERRFYQYPTEGGGQKSSSEMLPLGQNHAAPRQLWWRSRPPLEITDQSWVLRPKESVAVKAATGATSVNWHKVDAGVELEWAAPSSENRQQGVLKFRTAPLAVGASVLLILRPSGAAAAPWLSKPNVDLLDLSGCTEQSENFVTMNLTKYEIDQKVGEEEDSLQPGQQRRYTLPARPEVYPFSAKLSVTNKLILRTAFRGPSMKQVHCVLYHQSPQSKFEISNVFVFP